MTLTIHYINNDWKLQRRIINFYLTPNHKGETIKKKKHVEACLNEQGVNKLVTIIMDNASFNDEVITYLNKKIAQQGLGFG